MARTFYAKRNISGQVATTRANVYGAAAATLSELGDIFGEIEDDKRKGQIAKADVTSLVQQQEEDNWQIENAPYPDTWTKHYQDRGAGDLKAKLEDVNDSWTRQQISEQHKNERRLGLERIKGLAETQTIKNTRVDYDLGLQKLSEVPKYKGIEDMHNILNKGGDFIKVEPGRERTKAEEEAEELNLARIHVKGWVLQDVWERTNEGELTEEQALAELDKINNFAKKERDVTGMFTPAEIAELKKDYLDRKKFTETEAKKAREGREHEVETEARNMSIEGDWGGGIEIINNSLAEFGVDWHTDALNKYRNAYSIQNQTGSNVYKTTHNPIAFGEMRDKVLAGTATEKEIRSNVGPNGYSTTDEAYLLKLQSGDESKAKAFEDSAAVTILKGLIEGMPVIEEEITEPFKDYIQEYSLRLLEDTVKKNPDWTNREKKEEAFRVYLNVKRAFEAGEIELDPEKLPGHKKPYEGLDIKKLEKLDRELAIKVTTPEDLAALPSGTVFLAPNGKLRRKK